MESKPPLANAARFRTAADRVAVVVNGRAKQVTEELVETLDQIVKISLQRAALWDEVKKAAADSSVSGASE